MSCKQSESRGDDDGLIVQNLGSWDDGQRLLYVMLQVAKEASVIELIKRDRNGHSVIALGRWPIQVEAGLGPFSCMWRASILWLQSCATGATVADMYGRERVCLVVLARTPKHGWWLCTHTQPLDTVL